MNQLTDEVEGVDPEIAVPLGLCTGIGTLTLAICKGGKNKEETCYHCLLLFEPLYTNSWEAEMNTYEKLKHFTS